MLLSIPDKYLDAYSAQHFPRLHRRRVRILNLVLTKKLTDKLCLFITYMTYVAGQLFPYIFWCLMLIHRLRRWPNIEPTLVWCIVFDVYTETADYIT